MNYDVAEDIDDTTAEGYMFNGKNLSSEEQKQIMKDNEKTFVSSAPANPVRVYELKQRKHGIFAREIASLSDEELSALNLILHEENKRRMKLKTFPELNDKEKDSIKKNDIGIFDAVISYHNRIKCCTLSEARFVCEKYRDSLKKV